MNSRAFAKRLLKIQHIACVEKRQHQLARLLALFKAVTVRTDAGTVVGYQLPDGEWFCRKILYHSEAEAEIAASVLRRKGRGNCHTYVCHTCGHWHLTSSNPNKKNSYTNDFNKQLQ